jgi:cysteine sulfinate desulfinase/cysteine desulfurase-like protein
MLGGFKAVGEETVIYLDNSATTKVRPDVLSRDAALSERKFRQSQLPASKQGRLAKEAIAWQSKKSRRPARL